MFDLADPNEPQRAGPHRLRKARILDTRTTDVVASKAQLLADIDDVRDEEVTRSGITLRIVEQLARGADGETWVWRGREKRAGRGEASSGLSYDGTTPT